MEEFKALVAARKAYAAGQIVLGELVSALDKFLAANPEPEETEETEETGEST